MESHNKIQKWRITGTVFVRECIFTFIFALFIQSYSKELEVKTKIIRPVNCIVEVEFSGDQNRTLPGKVQAADNVDLSFQVSGSLVNLPVSKG